MADLQRLDPSVVITPTQTTDSAYQTAAARGGQQTAALAQVVMTAADTAVQYLGRDEAERGMKDAAQIVDRDGNGVLQPPSSFSPEGIQTKAYADAYTKTRQAAFTQTWQQQLEEKKASLVNQFPTDPTAVAEMLEKERASMLTGIDPKWASSFEARFNGVKAQGVSQSTNNMHVANQKQASADALLTLHGTAERIAARAVQEGKISPSAAEATAMLSNEDIAQTLHLLETTAGYTPSMVQATKNQVALQVIARTMDGHLSRMDLQANPSLGGIDPEKRLQAMNYIKATAAKSPEFADKIEAMGNQSLGKAIEYGTVVYAASQQQAQIAAAQNGVEAQKARQTYGPASTQYQDTLLTQMNSAFLNERMPASQRIALMQQAEQGLLQIGQTRQALIIQEQTSAVQAATNVITAPVGQKSYDDFGTPTRPPNTTTPAEKQEAFNQLVQLRAGPSYANMPMDLKNRVEAAAQSYVRSGVTQNVAALDYMADQGMMKPAELQEIISQMHARGEIGDPAIGAHMTPAHALKMIDTNRTAWEKKQAGQNLGSSAMAQAHATGTYVSNAEARQVIEKVQPFHTPDGRPADINNPDHVAAAVQYRQQNRFLPAAIQKQLDALPNGGNAATLESASLIHKAIAADYASQSDISSGMAIGRANAEIGSSAKILFDTTKWGGLEALKLQSASKDTVNASTGQNAINRQQEMDTELPRLLRDGAAMAHQWVLPRSMDPGANENLGDPASIISKLSEKKNEGFGRTVSDVLQKVRGRPFSTVGFGDPALEAQFKKEMSDALIINADAVARAGINKHEFAFGFVMKRYMENMEIVTDPGDPTKGVIQFKKTDTLVAEATGIPREQVTPARAEAYLNGMMRAAIGSSPHATPGEKAQILAEMTQPKLDFQVDGYGQTKMVLTAMRNGSSVTLGTIDPKGDLFRGYGSLIKNEAELLVNQKVSRGYMQNLGFLTETVLAPLAKVSHSLVGEDHIKQMAGTLLDELGKPGRTYPTGWLATDAQRREGVAPKPHPDEGVRRSVDSINQQADGTKAAPVQTQLQGKAAAKETPADKRERERLAKTGQPIPQMSPPLELKAMQRGENLPEDHPLRMWIENMRSIQLREAPLP